jgi:hypothetical protein
LQYAPLTTSFSLQRLASATSQGIPLFIVLLPVVLALGIVLIKDGQHYQSKPNKDLGGEGQIACLKSASQK